MVIIAMSTGTLVLYFLLKLVPLDLNRKIRLQYTICAFLLTVLTYQLTMIYSTYTAGVTFVGLLLLFACIFGKQTEYSERLQAEEPEVLEPELMADGDVEMIDSRMGGSFDVASETNSELIASAWETEANRDEKPAEAGTAIVEASSKSEDYFQHFESGGRGFLIEETRTDNEESAEEDTDSDVLEDKEFVQSAYISEKRVNLLNQLDE